VPNKIDVAFFLNTHYTGEFSVSFKPPENDAILDFVLELFPGHIRLVPSVRRNDAFVRLSGIVDDFIDRVEI
jgi:hypothetical protein